MKNTQQFVLGLVCCFSAGVVRAGSDEFGWKVHPLDDVGFAARSTKLNLEVSLETVGGDPEILSFVPSPERKDIYLLVYSAGSGGTSEIVDFEKAAVIDIQKKKFLGSAPWKTLSHISREKLKEVPEKNSKPEAQPEWTWTANKVSVADPRTGDVTEIALGNAKAEKPTAKDSKSLR